MSETNLEIWKHWKQSSQKFDYFIVTLSSALFAYLGSNLEISNLLNIPKLFEILSLLCFCVSSIYGILRIKSDMDTLEVKLQEPDGSSHAHNESFKKELQFLNSFAIRTRVVCIHALLLGFLLLVLSKLALLY